MPKKIVSFLIAITLVLPMFLTKQNEAYASTGQDVQDVSLSDDLEVIKPYVEVTEEGTIRFKKLPKGFYEKYNLEELQKHFDNLNTLSKAGNITINEDLSIQEKLPVTRAKAVYGKWTYHWWGYDRKFNNAQAKAYMNQLNTAAAGAAIVAGLASPFPPVAGIAGVQSGYWSLLSARVDANNKGRGVYVAVTYALVFNIKPL